MEDRWSRMERSLRNSGSDSATCLFLGSELEVTELKERGWTDTLIRNFLGMPHAWGTVNHFRNFTGKKLWNLQTVHEIEASEAFEEAFRLSVKRRRLTDSTVEKMMENRNRSSEVLRLWREKMSKLQPESPDTPRWPEEDPRELLGKGKLTPEEQVYLEISEMSEEEQLRMLKKMADIMEKREKQNQNQNQNKKK